MNAREPYRSACLRVLGRVLLDCRAGLRSGTMTPEQAAAAIDAVHNIPELLEDWARCNLDQLRAELRGYDASWPGSLLSQIFEQTVRRA